MIQKLMLFDFNAWLLLILLVAFLTLVGNLIFRNNAALLHQRIEDMGIFTSGTKQEKIMKQTLTKRLTTMAEQRFSGFVEKHVQKGKLAPLRIKLVQAGMDIDPVHFHTHRIVYSVLFSALTLFFGKPLIVIIAFVVGFFVPDLQLRENLKKRQYKLKSEIPDFLDLLAATAPSAKNLEDAILKVCERTESQISNEFRTTLEEVNTGRQMRDALRDMSQRCGVAEIEGLISQINQSEAFGTPVEKTLQVQAVRLRVLKKQLAEIKARNASVLLILPSLLLLVTCLVMIVGPSVIGVFDPQAMFD